MKTFKNPIAFIYAIGFAFIIAGIFMADDIATPSKGMILIGTGANIILWGMIIIGIQDNKRERAKLFLIERAELATIEEQFSSDENFMPVTVNPTDKNGWEYMRSLN